MLLDGKRAFRAGDWTVEPEVNSLRRNGQERRVEPKVMQVLVTLASRQNHVFPKAELLAAVWPDTFVSEDVLTRCISILRRITADDPQAPHFIQTVPRVGYRLVATVEVIEPEVSTDSLPPPALLSSPSATILAPVNEPQVDVASPASYAVKPAPDRQVKRAFAILSGIVLALICTAFVSWRIARRGHTTASVDAVSSSTMHTVIFTPEPGVQSSPAFSPDGSAVAFVRSAEDSAPQQICVKRIGDTACKLLAPSAAQQFSPAWSPDGDQLAFLASTTTERGIYVVQAGGGAPARKVYTPEEPSHWEQGALSWSKDGRSLIFPDHQNSSPFSVIVRLELESGRTETLTDPPKGWEGDLNPVYSPDGSRIAFTRASETAIRDLCWLDLHDRKVHQLTHEPANIDGLSWTRDGKAIIFASNTGGQYALWRATLLTGSVIRMPVGTENATQPAVGPRPGQLAFTQSSATWSIDRLGTTTAITASTQEDSAPSVSPNGRQFAFQSRRSGTQQIWIAASDGTQLRPLQTNLGRMVGSPAWSHTGDQILFDGRPDGHSHIFVMSARGGPARQLTFGEANDIVPRWSANDRCLYFRSNRSGRWQLWRVGLDGTGLIRITDGDGIAGQETEDGSALYYTRGDQAGLWKRDLKSGRESQVSSDPPAGYWGYAQLTKRGILLLSQNHGNKQIRLLPDRPSEAHAPISLQHLPPLFQGLSSTADEHVVLVSGEREMEQHISLVNDTQLLP